MDKFARNPLAWTKYGNNMKSISAYHIKTIILIGENMEYSVLLISVMTKNNLHFEKSWSDIKSNPHLLNCVGSKSNFSKIYQCVFKMVSEFHKKGLIKGS